MDLNEYRFSESHMWAKIEGNEVVIGLTEYAVNELGDIIFAELPDVGSRVDADEPMGSIESAKAVEDIAAPVTGEVVRVNEEVINAPELLNEDPYEAAWLMAVAPNDIKDLDSLLSYDQYLSLIEEVDDDEEEEEDDEDLFSNDE
jgi:glycine cleavage system H protein